MFKAPSFPLIAFGLCQISHLAAQDESFLASRDQALIQDLKPSLGLTRNDSVRVSKIVQDPLMQGHDARIAQFYRGVRVMGGEAILHMSGPRTRSITDAFVRELNLDTTPDVPPGEALAVAVNDLGPKGLFKKQPAPQLVVARLATADALVYRIHMELENGARETAHMDYLVDAHTGKILKKWSTLRTGKAALGQGLSQYSGSVTLNTTQKDSKDKAKSFELRDWTRGRTGNTIFNLNHGTEDDDGVLYTDTSNIWGDGQNYSGGSTTSHNGETAGVDAAYGLQETWDYYAKVHGRKGIDDKGTATSMRVHYDTSYDNAFWSDSCFCVTVGDGRYFKSLTSIDVLGHELSHGVCSATANLDYYGESGGLNESNSDIQGTLVKFYARGGSGDTVGNWGGTWTVGEDLAMPDHPGPLRYMYKPSKDGSSADMWSSDLDTLDVHNSSGPMNRCFYFLSQGSSPSRTSDYYTCALPGGMEGVGNDKAAHIWYRALTHYLTSQSIYKDARTACISASQDLYGAGSPEEQAVWNAFHGILVGPTWKK